MARTYLFQERIREGLYPELEWTEIRRLVEALHLLSHERLVYGLAFRVGGVNCKQTSVSANSTHTSESKRQCERARAHNAW